MDSHSTALDLGSMVRAMREAYHRGDNAMEAARALLNDDANLPFAVLVAYDLQAGTYAASAGAHPDRTEAWCTQLAALLRPYVETSPSSLLEVGVGEATTLAGVVERLGVPLRWAGGFDVSWSRIDAARGWLAERHVDAATFVGDLFAIPMADGAVDIVYSSHSLEPNGGRELEAVRECLRVARRAVVLVEPLYELAAPEAQARMSAHGYVRGLREAAESLGARVVDHRLLPYTGNLLNPSGVLLLEKTDVSPGANDLVWRCPLTHAQLTPEEDLYVAADTGIAYPVLRGIPLLRPEHAVVASRLATHSHR